MKRKLTGLLRCYASALRRHVSSGSDESLSAAIGLATEAADLGLNAQGLVRIHKLALNELKTSSPKKARTKRAETFLTRAASTFAATSRTRRVNNGRLDTVIDPGDRREKKFVSANDRWQRDDAGSMACNNVFKQDGKDINKCLEASLQMQERLRRLTHDLLAAHEGERQRMSGKLRDEIAQTLLGIVVRLRLLKERSRSNPEELKKEIASTRRLVVESARFVRRFAIEFAERQ